MDDTPSDWMRFVLMSEYAKKLFDENNKLKKQLEELNMKREALYSMLSR
jgi:hypothetical protein